MGLDGAKPLRLMCFALIQNPAQRFSAQTSGLPGELLAKKGLRRNTGKCLRFSGSYSAKEPAINGTLVGGAAMPQFIGGQQDFPERRSESATIPQPICVNFARSLRVIERV